MLKGELVTERRAFRVTDPIRRVLDALAARNTPKAMIQENQEALAESLVEEDQNTQDWPSLDEVYEEVKFSITTQNERLKTIDAKANFGLAAATLLTAGVTGLGRALAESGTNVPEPERLLGFDVPVNRLVDAVTVASLVVYAIVAFCAFMAYRLRDFDESPDPMRLVEKYVHDDPRTTKAAIAYQRAKNYEANQKVIDRKAFWTKWTMLLLILEAVLLVVIAFIQVQWL